MLFDIDVDVLQKYMWKSTVLINLLNAYSSTKDKALFKYFVGQSIWKNTSNSWWLLFVFPENSL